MEYKNDAFESIHESMSGLYKLGIVDEKVMREFDEGCLMRKASKDSQTTANPSIHKPKLAAKSRV